MPRINQQRQARTARLKTHVSKGRSRRDAISRDESQRTGRQLEGGKLVMKNISIVYTDAKVMKKEIQTCRKGSISSKADLSIMTKKEKEKKSQRVYESLDQD